MEPTQQQPQEKSKQTPEESPEEPPPGPPPGPPPTYMFDVVVTNLVPEGVEIANPKRLSIDVNVNEMPLTLTSSSINVNKFKPGSGLQITTQPDDLRQALEFPGMTFEVKYDDLPVGNGQISFPTMVTERIEREMSDEVTHADTCMLVNQKQPAGMLEVLCRLYIRCNEQENSGGRHCQGSMDNNIDPQDIMFVVGPSQNAPNTCDPCLGFMESDTDYH